MSVIPDLKTLYEIDDSLWLEETIERLKARKFEELDLENLIEELEDLGSEKKHRVESLLRQIIIHLLLIEYWITEREYNQAHRESEIDTFRTDLNLYLTTNLRNYLARRLPIIYQDAVRNVRKKTRLSVLPIDCPYPIDRLLDIDWLPDLGKNLS